MNCSSWSGYFSEGGRLSNELAYTLKWLGEGSGTTYELIIQTPRGVVDSEVRTRSSSSNVLSVPSMLQHLEAVRAATSLSVELFDVYVPCSLSFLVVLVVQRFGVGLVIERSLVRLPAGALSSQLGR